MLQNHCRIAFLRNDIVDQLYMFLMKIVLFAKILGSTRLCKISQESSLLSNFGNLPKIKNARFGRSRPLGVNPQHFFTT